MLTEIDRLWTDLRVRIDLAEVRRYLGFRQGKTQTTGQVEGILTELVELTHTLVRPMGIGALYPVREADEELFISTELKISGPRTRSRLAGIEAAYIFAVTIGANLEERVSRHFQEGSYTNGAILDSMGSAAVESLAQEVNQRVRQLACQQGFNALERISPGYGDWPLEAQFQLFPLTRGEEIGIELSPSALLAPRKSITALIGIGPGLVPVQAGCASCDLIDCAFRYEGGSL